MNPSPKPGDVVVFMEGERELNAIVLRAHTNADGDALLHLLIARPEVSEAYIGTSRTMEAVRIEFDVPHEAANLRHSGAERWKLPVEAQISACVAGAEPVTEEGASDGDRQER